MIFVLAAIFLGYFAGKVFIRVLPVLLIATPLMFVIFHFHLY